MTPFAILSLPRSRSFWLAQLLTIGPWHVAHDQARYVRSVDDVRAWLSQDYVGSTETAAAAWWRLARHYCPDLRLVTVRRERRQVFDSLMRFGLFDGPRLQKILEREDRALDAAERAPGCISLSYEDLAHEWAIRVLWDHCLQQQPFDRTHYKRLATVNLQCNLPHMMQYMHCHKAQISRAAADCTRAQRYHCLKREVRPEGDDDGVVIREVGYSDLMMGDGPAIMSEHCTAIGLEADAWKRMNLDLWERSARAGLVLALTARLNGRIVGYSTAILGPNFEDSETIATQMTLFVTPNAAGLHLHRRLREATIERAKRRGASRLYLRAGTRGDGPRLGPIYQRLGARDFGHLYEMDLRSN